MYDPEHGWSLSFTGCGFLGVYHIGATCCLSERAPHLLRDARMFFGASAGALHCVTFLAGLPPEQVIQVVVEAIQRARNRNLGVLHPSFNPSKYLREGLQKHLPANVHQLISGKVSISLTRVSDLENVLVSDFESKDEVVDALICTSFIPVFCGLIPPSFRGVRYIDGGVTNSLPMSDAKTTITVSPFHGESDICPKVKSTNFFHVDFTQLSLRLCSENIYLLSCVLFPPDVKVLAEICFQGYTDAIRFLEENGICNKLHPCLNLSLPQQDVLAPPCETTSLEASLGVAAWPTKPPGNKLLNHLGTLPWDESIPETLSPQITIAMREILKIQGGYMNKICNSLPVKVMSYVMLPCTLPVESVIAVVQRLVVWLPYIPDDIQWFHSVTSQICSRVINHLLPTSRSQMLASSQQPSPHKPEHHGTSALLLPKDLDTGPVDSPVGPKVQTA
ncbi:1-acylglycerol-3-phosphate O-acyltransferase PNPLA3 [Rhinolophus sinicus]|uniref:1-acylglycerol-3-phosphate O-acyltransferase PNPLA3 n=1 Tax=Rhinolophus sinicus TaxID=89399 RepID=UPI003D7AF32A